MAIDSGRSPADAGSGHSAEPEPICVVSAVPASVPNAVRAIDDWCRQRQAKLVARSNEHILLGRNLDDPDYRALLGEHRAYMAVRSFIHGSRLASAIEAAAAGETMEIGSTEGESAVGATSAETPNPNPIPEGPRS